MRGDTTLQRISLLIEHTYLVSLATPCPHTMLFVYIIVNVCKQLLISGGSQLLGNEDGVKIALGSALPIGNSISHFNYNYERLKKIVIYSVFSCFN